MTTTVAVGDNHLTIDVDPFDGITVSYTSAGRLTHTEPCDSIAMALGVIADEVVRLSADRLAA